MASTPQTSSLTDRLRRATVVGVAAAVTAVGLPAVVAAPAAAAPASLQAAKPTTSSARANVIAQCPT